MILVDTAVWVDHLHSSEAGLVAALLADNVITHPLVVEELASGRLARRGEFIEYLSRFANCPVLNHEEWLVFVDQRRLWGRGLSPVDIHLLGSTLLTPGCRLWTRDKRLGAAATDVGVLVHGEAS
jgi:predicted nucleic acid-binding protein